MSGTQEYLRSMYGDDPDAGMALAAETLSKIAAEEDFDLNSLDDDQIAGLMQTLMGAEDTGDSGKQDDNKAEETQEQPDGQQQDQQEVAVAEPEKTSSNTAATLADVAVELAKIAAAEGFDLNTLSPEQRVEIVQDLAAQMSDPGYQQKVAEAQEKLAEADLIGRAMARSFDDEMKKISGAMDSVRKAGRTAVDYVKNTAGKAGRAVAGQAEETAQQARRLPGEYGFQREVMGRGKVRSGLEALRRSPRIAAAAGTAAAGTVAGSAALAHHATKDKKSQDEAVVAKAREILEASGYDPDTGAQKVASDEQIHQAALELLREKGWNVE